MKREGKGRREGRRDKGLFGIMSKNSVCFVALLVSGVYVYGSFHNTEQLLCLE